MRKLKPKLKPPKLPKSDKPIYVFTDALAYYEYVNRMYEKHQLAEMGRCIFATLRGETYTPQYLEL